MDKIRLAICVSGQRGFLQSIPGPVVDSIFQPGQQTSRLPHALPQRTLRDHLVGPHQEWGRPREGKVKEHALHSKIETASLACPLMSHKGRVHHKGSSVRWTCTWTRPLGSPNLRFKGICKQYFKLVKRLTFKQPAQAARTGKASPDSPAVSRQKKGRRASKGKKERREKAETQFRTREQSSVLMHPLWQSLLTNRALTAIKCLALEFNQILGSTNKLVM